MRVSTSRASRSWWSRRWGSPTTTPHRGRLGECDAVRLFADRAQAVKADFTVDATNRADVVAVCTRLDGVALAIELAAARIPAMSPASWPAPRPAVPAPQRRWPGRDRTPPDAPRRDRLVLRAVDRARTAAVGAAWRCSREAARSTRPKRCAPAIRSTPTTCSSCSRASWRVRSSSPTPVPTPGTGCWRRSASTARNALPRPARPTRCGSVTRTTTPSSPASCRVTSTGRDKSSGERGWLANTTTCSRRWPTRSTPKTSTSRSGSSASVPAYRSAGQRRGGLRSGAPARVAGRHRASRLRGRAHAPPATTPGSRRETPSSPWRCATSPSPPNNGSAPPRARTSDPGRRNFGDRSPRQQAHTNEAVDHYLDAARRARADDVPGLAAFCLGMRRASRLVLGPCGRATNTRRRARARTPRPA